MGWDHQRHELQITILIRVQFVVKVILLFDMLALTYGSLWEMYTVWVLVNVVLSRRSDVRR
jgi:hypothetical protein